MTIRKPAFSLLTLVFAAIATLSTMAHADTISLVINNTPQTGSAGQTLTYNATIAAPTTNTANIFLNGLGASTPGFGPVDGTDFIINFPAFLAPGQSFTADLFTTTLAANILPGKYIGAVGILGGPLDSSFDTLAVASFEVDVAPEPSTWVLLITGAGALAGVVYMRRRETMASGMVA